jgi:hypothetical protein
LLHGEERKVWGDGGYRGQTKAIQQAEPKAQDMTCKRMKFKNYVDEVAKEKNTTKSKVTAKVEHVFRIVKRVFGFDKVRYRGSPRTTTGCALTSLSSIFIPTANISQDSRHKYAWRPESGLRRHEKPSKPNCSPLPRRSILVNINGLNSHHRIRPLLRDSPNSAPTSRRSRQ